MHFSETDKEKLIGAIQVLQSVSLPPPFVIQALAYLNVLVDQSEELDSSYDLPF